MGKGRKAFEVTPETDAYIRENFATVTTREMAAHLGVGICTLRKWAMQRGLKKDRCAINRHISESNRRTFAIDRARKRAGLPQLTRRKLSLMPLQKMKNKSNRRHYLKSLGYIVDGDVARWNAETRRSKRIEDRRPGDRGYYGFRFMPCSED